MAPLQDITGLRFGRLVAVAHVGRNRFGHARFVFRCECGREHLSDSRYVRSGRTRSCGCLRRDSNHARRKG
jgi:hypothetical protein